jgi:hypothetical protein
MQVFFYSDAQTTMYEPVESNNISDKKVYLLFQCTRRPFMKSKTNFNALLVVHAYFADKRLFLPVFFALLNQSDQQK